MANQPGAGPAAHMDRKNKILFLHGLIAKLEDGNGNAAEIFASFLNGELENREGVHTLEFLALAAECSRLTWKNHKRTIVKFFLYALTSFKDDPRLPEIVDMLQEHPERWRSILDKLLNHDTTGHYILLNYYKASLSKAKDVDDFLSWVKRELVLSPVIFQYKKLAYLLEEQLKEIMAERERTFSDVEKFCRGLNECFSAHPRYEPVKQSILEEAAQIFFENNDLDLITQQDIRKFEELRPSLKQIEKTLHGRALRSFQILTCLNRIFTGHSGKPDAAFAELRDSDVHAAQGILVKIIENDLWNGNYRKALLAFYDGKGSFRFTELLQFIESNGGTKMAVQFIKWSASQPEFHQANGKLLYYYRSVLKQYFKVHPSHVSNKKGKNSLYNGHASHDLLLLLKESKPRFPRKASVLLIGAGAAMVGALLLLT